MGLPLGLLDWGYFYVYIVYFMMEWGYLFPSKKWVFLW